MWGKVILAEILVAAVIYLMLPKELCNCGVSIPEGGGMCECAEYNSRVVIKIDTHCDSRQKVFEDELRRIEEEKRKGNSYDTFL